MMGEQVGSVLADLTSKPQVDMISVLAAVAFKVCSLKYPT